MRDGRIAPAWRWVALVPALWLAHVGAMYAIASLRCLDLAFTGELAGVVTVRALRVLVTVLVAGGLAVVAAALWRRRREGDDEEQLATFAGAVLGGIFALYLLWSLWPALGTTSCS
ncbi:MAG: hypothetical protein ACJ76L_14690 [Conexibacter sp.]